LLLGSADPRRGRVYVDSGLPPPEDQRLDDARAEHAARWERGELDPRRRIVWCDGAAHGEPRQPHGGVRRAGRVAEAAARDERLDALGGPREQAVDHHRAGRDEGHALDAREEIRGGEDDRSPIAVAREGHAGEADALAERFLDRRDGRRPPLREDLPLGGCVGHRPGLVAHHDAGVRQAAARSH
jgi:hypothetical protein